MGDAGSTNWRRRMIPAATRRALFDELHALEKNGGLKETFNVVKKVPSQIKERADKVALKAIARAQGNKVGRVVVDNVMDPINHADIAHGVGNLMRMLGK